MTALLPLAQLPLTCDELDDQQDHRYGVHGDITIEHDFLRSLITGGLWKTEGKQTVLSVSLPETAVAGGLARPVALPVIRIGEKSRNGYRSLTGSGTGKSSLLTESMADQSTESVAVETAPSSPPELSYSKSSKSSSSSTRSSSVSDIDSTEKLSHFEDITLEASRDSVEDDSNLKPESRPTLRRPANRSPKSTEDLMMTKSAPSQHELRIRPNGASSRYPSLQGAVNGVLRDQSLNLPMGRTMRRGFTSPSSPSFMVHAPQRIPSRSPSPIKPMPNGIPPSPRSYSSATPKASLEVSSPHPTGTFARRQSWQPGRKTAKQLEAEFNDDDEEVPDEAVLENVPISPMPGMQRPSRTPSPQRRPPVTPQHAHLHSAKIPKGAKRPSAPPVMPNGQLRSPRSPKHGRPPMIPHSATVMSFSPEPFSHKHRSKSWHEDLNDEARQLSEALEDFADRASVEKHGSVTNSAASSPPRPSFQSMKRTRTNIMELPPMQKGNIMIDPLPVSKEKEAVLSRTRPSWLPPKCQKEEQKHLREWKQIMARAAEAEKKRAIKEREDIENREEMQGSIARIWEEHVLPNWDQVVNEPRTRELWWRGVTPSSRAYVWKKAIGNELELSSASFEAARARANDLEEKVAEMPSEERAKSKEAAWLDAIERDVPTVFPELETFQTGSQANYALSDVLKAYAMYRSDVGYVYGTHLVAGLLCLHMGPIDAFVTLANMLNRPLPLAFLVHDTTAMTRSYDLVLSTLKYKFGKLHSHLTSANTGLQPEDYLDPIFRCLFAYNMSSEHVSRIWDIFVFEGDKALIRAAVAVLGRLEGKLYGTHDEVLDALSWRNVARWDVGSEEDFIKAVRDAGKVDGKSGSAI